MPGEPEPLRPGLRAGGSICVSFAHYSEYPVPAGQILLVPANENFCGKALGDCRVITCALCGEMALCNKFSLKMLAPYAESLPPTDAPATLPATPILKDGLELAYASCPPSCSASTTNASSAKSSC